MIKHCGFIHQIVIVILVLLIRISYLSNFLKCQLKFSPNYEKSFSLQLASYSDFFSPKKKNLVIVIIVSVWLQLLTSVISTLRVFLPFFFFFSRNFWPILPWTVHHSTIHGSHELHFSASFSLKTGPAALFTHLKIILQKCFQFSVKISCIQTDP